MQSTAPIYKLPELKYATNALEPVLSKTLIEIHHGKHHQTYVNNLNATYDKIVDAQKTNDVKKIAELQGALRFNLGGHLNHSLYWDNLAPVSSGGGVLPNDSTAFAAEVKRIWGSFDNLIAEFNKRTVAIQVNNQFKFIIN
jgi:Fe-Mn family superoxide dismutase